MTESIERKSDGYYELGTKKENYKNLIIRWIGQSGEILNMDKKDLSPSTLD
jgi:hypothetical protein